MALPTLSVGSLHMEWLWLIIVPVALVGGFFLVKGFMRLHGALKELQTSISDLGSAGTDLKKVQSELDRWRDAVDKTRHQ